MASLLPWSGKLCAQKLGIDRQRALGDSLTVYAQARADVQRVIVKSCRISGNRIDVRTNSSLSCLSLSGEDIKTLRGKVSFWVRGDRQGRVSIYSDNRELNELVTSRFRPRKESDKHKKADGALVTCPDAPYDSQSGLQGKNIALWPSHGMFLRLGDSRWMWQRARLWTTVEDLLSFSFTSGYLVPMLEQSGAVVLQPRERDLHRAERVDTTGGLTHPLTMAVTDDYALYVRYTRNPSNSPRAVYTVRHQGVETRVEVNQQAGGSQWLYIGTYAFGPDSAANRLTLTDGTNSGMALSHEGLKIGGGVGVSGYPRYMEGARYWLEYNGLPDSVYTYEKKRSHYLDDLVCRGRWVNYMNERLDVPVHLALAVHTDAGVRGGDSIVGTLAIYSEKDKDGHTRYRGGGNRLIGRDLADYVQTQVVEDMRATLCPKWARRELKDGVYAESRIPRVPVLLVEMLSHQNQNDMRYGLDSRARFVISRAIYKGVLRFLHEQDGTDYVVQPLPVRDFAIRRVAGRDSVLLSWRSRHDSLEATAAPSYYVVYSRLAGGDWDNGTRVDCERVTLPLERGRRYDFVVRAGNAGGVSMPSEQLSAYIAPTDSKQAVIINGFDEVYAPDMMEGDSLTGGIVPGSLAVPYGADVSYIGGQIDFDKSHPWVSDDECGYGMCANDCADMTVAGNTFDYPSLHGAVLERLGYSYVSQSLASSDSLPQADLVDVILGKDRQGIGALSAVHRSVLTNHLHGGGRLLLCGSYLGSAVCDEDTRMWARTTLHYLPGKPKATRSGLIELQLSGGEETVCQLFMQPNETRIACECPDAIEPDGVSRSIGRYADSFLSAGVATGRSILVLPFMPESVCEFDTLYERCVRFLEGK